MNYIYDSYENYGIHIDRANQLYDEYAKTTSVDPVEAGVVGLYDSPEEDERKLAAELVKQADQRRVNKNEQ